MKKLLVILILATGAAQAQTYTLQSIPVYDENGNVYMTRSVYDHIPTSSDSAEFFKSSKEYVFNTTKEIKAKQERREFPIVVGAIRKMKSGKLMIKENSKYNKAWYRCKDNSVKIGDTVWVSRKDIIQIKQTAKNGR